MRRMAGPDAVSTLKSYMVEFGDRETTSGWMERDERDRKKKKREEEQNPEKRQDGVSDIKKKEKEKGRY